VLERLAGQVRDADGLVFIAGEYNWGFQPGLRKISPTIFWSATGIACASMRS
jgi:hypothetical protein